MIKGIHALYLEVYVNVNCMIEANGKERGV
jgi:hypothetical protein